MTSQFLHDPASHICSLILGYSIVLFLCFIFRKIALALFGKGSFAAVLLLECIASFQCIVGTIEGGGIALNFGVWGWVVFTIIRVIIQELTFFKSTADPADTLVSGSISLFEKALIIPAQLLFGELAQRAMPVLWSFSPSSLHLYKSDTIDALCDYDLKVDAWLGFVIQFFYILSIIFVSYVTPQRFRLVLVTVYLVLVSVPGLPYTGMYTNPLSATILNWKCDNQGPLTHIIVYVLPPILATLLANTILPGSTTSNTESSESQSKKDQ